MKCLKAGIEPKRGNPNKPEEQEEFDTEEGKKPSIRNSSKGGTAGYPSLGPPPDLGLPGEESKSEKSDDDDNNDDSNQNNDDDDDSSDEPEEKPQTKSRGLEKKPVAKPAERTRRPTDTKKKDKNFYKAIEQAKKHCKNVLSNLNYSKVEPSIEELEKALEILRELE